MNDRIRNFSIIAHIDHGKSTLADRMLEVTGTIEARKMRAQVLDQMELERERGITIKMQPVRMLWNPQHADRRIDADSTQTNTESDTSAGGVNQIESYVLNLIDTPGHIDFSYEVSRALTAVEGVVLLVDATQGIQAQTLTTLGMARAAGCVIIPVVSKIDAPAARIPEVRAEVAGVLGVSDNEVFLVSGKTGEGVSELLAGIIARVPPPAPGTDAMGGRALVFDFSYSEHRGIIAYVRVADGSITAKDQLLFSGAHKRMIASEVGCFAPEMKQTQMLVAGEIGYIVTGIKEPGVALVGDTILAGGSSLSAFPGYQTPRPVVWASLYPENQNDFPALKQALGRLHLSDAALSFEEDGSAILGKGFRCGFLGMLHMEIVTERLKREFGCNPILTAPSITYEITDEKGVVMNVVSPIQFPEEGTSKLIREQWVTVSIIMPPEYLSPLHQLLYEHEAVIGDTRLFGDVSAQGTPAGGRIAISAEMPLRELMRGFFDRLKSESSGFASLSYEFADWRPADVCRLDILIAEELMPAFSRIISSRRVEEESRRTVDRLAEILPRQLFVLKIQAKAKGRIIASRTLSAMRKDVTGYLYGGDITRKKKLLEKQKKGKERRGEHARVNIPPDIFLKMVKPD